MGVLPFPGGTTITIGSITVDVRVPPGTDAAARGVVARAIGESLADELRLAVNRI
jgi:hypothetical protein